MKRLFIFAAYCPDGTIPRSLQYYLKALGECGDVVFASDSELGPGAQDLLAPLVLHAEGSRHGEYDFGSYKRAYVWAAEEGILGSYDMLYLVNDSVFGPLFPLEDCLLRMESKGTGASCIAYNPHHAHPHMQSWFVGLRSDVFASGWFDSFIRSVVRQESKEAVCVAYENGLTELVASHGVSVSGLYEIKGRRIYNNPRDLFRMGFPFVKKDSFRRHGGSLGGQLKWVCDRMEPDLRRAVLSEIPEGLLISNPLKIAARYLTYLSGKL